MQGLNNKFIILVLAFVAIAVCSVGVVYAFRTMQDPTRHVEHGRELEKAGDFLGAYKAYGRAVAKRRSSIEYMDLMRGALLKIVPPTTEEARQYYDMNLAVLRQRARVDPVDPEPWKLLLAELDERGQFLQSMGAWQLLADAAADMAKSVPSGSPASRLADRELGYALAQRDSMITEKERARAEELLRAVLKADPKEERAWEGLFIILLNDYNRQTLANQKLPAQERLKQLEQALVDADAAIPGSAAVPLARARLIRAQLMRGELEPKAALAALEPALDALEDVAAAPNASARTIINAADQLLTTARRDDAKRAVTLVDRWVNAHPDDLIMRRLLAIALQQYDADQSLAIAKGILEAPASAVSMQSAFRDEIRADAAERIFDIELARALQTSNDDSKKKAHLEAAEKMREVLAEVGKGRSDDTRLLKAEAKLALYRNDAITASAKLDRVLAVNPQADAEVYLLAADAAARRSELGGALSYINRGLEKVGSNYALLLTRARVELGLMKGAEAIRTADVILAARPGDATALEIRAEGRKIVDAQSPEGSRDPLVRALQDSEKKLTERDIAGARTIIEELLKTSDDPRVLTQAGRIELMADEQKRAIEYLDRALAKAPHDAFIQHIRAIAGTNDPLERIDKLVELSVADEKLRPAARYAMLLSVISGLRNDIAAGGRTPDGRLRDVDELKKTLARLEAEVPAAREAATSSSSGSAVFAARFDEAVLARDYVKAEAIGAETEQAGERALGAFLRSRALALQEKGTEAVAVLEKARQQGINSADIARQLGQLYEGLGRVNDALAAYKESYDLRPQDLLTLRSYSDLLQRSGDPVKALQLLKDAALRAIGNRDIMNSWLKMESLVGDRGVALCWRRKIYREMPSDRENALALAVLLTEGRADQRLLIDDKCNPKFKDAEWNALTPVKRQQEIMAMIKAHTEEGNGIFKSILTGRSDDFEAALLQARAMRNTGKADVGEKLLRTVIEHAKPEQRGPMWFGLGQYLEEIGRSAEAKVAFAESQKIQDPVRREADITIADYWFERQVWQSAYDVLKPVVDGQTNPDPKLLRRLSEICIKLYKYDEAQSYLDKSKGGANSFDVVGELLYANIEHGRGESAWSRGAEAQKAQKKTEADALFAQADAHYAKAEASLTRATEIAPGNALPWLSMASLQREMYMKRRDPAVLDRALVNAEKGSSMASGFWPGVRLREDLLVEKGDLTAATQVVERYLPVAVGNAEARKHLADLFLRTGNPQRAIAVLQEGAILSPTDPGWQLAIGELQLRRGQFGEAITAFDRAINLAATPGIIAKAIEARQRSTPPDWPGIVALARQYPTDVSRSGAMRAALGASLYYTGERDNGLQALAEAGRYIRDEIAAGRMRSTELDSWYGALRHVFPPARTADLDAFVNQTFEKKLTPDDQRWLAAIWTEIGKDGVSNAMKYLDQARTAMESQDALFRSRVWLAAGNLAYLNDDCSGAIDNFEKVVTEDPSNTMALNNLGYLLSFCKNEHARAIEFARRAVAGAPAQPEFLDTLGFALLKNGECNEARGVLERAIRIQPSATCYLHLAEAFHCTKRPEDARNALDQAVKLNPDKDTRAAIDTLRESLK